jgi:regulatory protein
MPIVQHTSELSTGGGRELPTVAAPTAGLASEAATEAHDVDADAESMARTIALRKLTARAHTRHELDKALQVKNVPQSVKEAVLDRMQEVGLVDDTSFAADWVASRQQRRHLSRRALKRELEAKGVERSDIDSALENVDRDTELSTARELVERKHVTMSALSRDVQWRRLAGLLSRRGFDTAVITRVLSDVLRD